MNQKVVRGPALIAVSLFFGLQAVTCHVGTLSKAGAGLFPPMISGVVGLVGLMWLVQSRFGGAQPSCQAFRRAIQSRRGGSSSFVT